MNGPTLMACGAVILALGIGPILMAKIAEKWGMDAVFWTLAAIGWVIMVFGYFGA